MNKYMKVAVAEAFSGMKHNCGGPFGAVIVRRRKIVARAHNEVIALNDPTAHAEIAAIRAASRKLKKFDLSDCEIYSSCEPCPMCLAAIYWARIKRLYYGCTEDDAADIGFADKIIYQAMRGKSGRNLLSMKMMDRKECLKPFMEWKTKSDRIQY